MPFLDKYTEERKTGGFLGRYKEAPVLGPELPQEPTFTKILKGVRSVREAGKKLLKPEEEISPLGFARHLGTAIPRFALEFLKAPHGLVKMMEEEPPPAEEAVEEFVRGIPLVGAGYRVAKGEGKELLHEYYKYPERAAMEVIMPYFMKHIFSMKPPPTKPALPRPSVPGMAEAYEKLARPKVEPRLAEKPAVEIPKAVKEKPAEIPAEIPEWARGEAGKVRPAELKAQAQEMLGETEFISLPAVTKGRGRRGVSVTYDPATTPEWYARAGLNKREAISGLKAIAKEGYKAVNQYARSLLDRGIIEDQVFIKKGLTPAYYAGKAELGVRGVPGVGKVQDLPSIARNLSRGLGVPIREGYFRRPGIKGAVRGIYKPGPEVVRIKTANDLSTISHEVAHHLDRKFSISERIKKTPELAEEIKKLDYEPKKARIDEGFAEFVRHWLTDETAQNVAPKSHEWFQRFGLKNPETFDVLRKAKSDISQWRTQGVDARVNATLVRKPIRLPEGMGEAARSAWTEFRMAVDEPLEPLKQFVRAAEKKIGKPVLERANPLDVAYATWKRSGLKAREFFDVATSDFDGRITGPPLRAIFKGVRGKEDQAVSYSYCKHALERWEQGKNPGISKSDARAYVEKYQSPEFETFAKELTAFSDRILDYLAESPGFSKEAATLFREIYQNYVPLFREKPSGTFLGGKGKGYADLPSPIRRAVGGGERVIDPVTNIMLQTEKLISWADRARVGKLVADLAEKAGGMGEWVEKVSIPAKAKRIKTSDVIANLEKEGIDIGKVTPEQLSETLTFWSTRNRGIPKDNIVTFFDAQGQSHAYQLKPQLYRSLKLMGGIQLPPALQIVTAPFRIAKKGVTLGATALRFSFGWGTNFLRDPWVYYLQSRYPKATPIGAMGSTAKVVKNKLGWNPSESWKLFQQLGGEWGTFFNAELPRVMKQSRRVIRDARRSKELNVIRHPFELYREVVNMPELGPRFKEFETVYKRRLAETGDHRSAWISAMNAQWEVTVPFGKYGYMIEIANQMIPFIGPQVAGLSMLFKTLRRAPVRTVTRGLGITAASLALWQMNKDKDWYKGLADWDKYGFWHFNIGSDEKPRIMRLPKPFEWGLVFASAPEAVANRMYADDPDALNELFGRAVEYTVPPLAPAIIGPVIDLSRGETGYDPFRERPIVPYWETLTLPPEARYGRYTTETAKKIGSILKVSPRKVDYFISALTGGGGSDVIRAVENIFGPGIEPREAEDLPYIGRFLSRSPFIGAFYDQYEKVKRVEARLSQLQGEKKTQYRDENIMLVRQLPAFKAASKKMSELRKLAKKIIESDKPNEEKSKLLIELDKRTEELARRTLKAIGYRGLKKEREGSASKFLSKY